MRTNPRSLPAAVSVLTLAASALALSGCATPNDHGGLRRHCPTTIVIVTYDQGTGKATMSESDKTVQLSEKSKDTVQWLSPDGVVYVTFLKESPFDSPPKHEKKVLKSGPPKKGAAGHFFDYEAELWLDPDGKNRVKIDPRIEVLP